jgi:hypothetical protein
MKTNIHRVNLIERHSGSRTDYNYDLTGADFDFLSPELIENNDFIMMEEDENDYSNLKREGYNCLDSEDE